MLKAGLTTGEIKWIISEAQTNFAISVSALVELKRAAVADEVITAMMDRVPQRDAASTVSSPMKNDGVGSTSGLKLTSPEVRVFRLGMPMQKVLTRFEKDLHVSDRNFSSSVHWTSSAEFYRTICEGLGLQFFPDSLHRRDDVNEHDYSDFVTRLEYHFGIMPQLHIFNPAAKGIVEKRRAAEELRKRQTFRP